jgi:very-short-patch-repair endonuclease
MTEYFNRPTEKDLRRVLRRKAPRAEQLLWAKLACKQLLGMKFRRQYSVGRYVVDFYCAEAKVGIELDGASHSTPQAKEYDEVRRAFIEGFGIRLLRVMNADVYERMDAVLELIAAALKTPASVTPS